MATDTSKKTLLVRKDWVMDKSSKVDLEKLFLTFNVLPTVDDEKSLIKSIFQNDRMKAGSTWYVLSQRPISIENADLSGGRFPGEIKKGLVEGVDYTLVPKEAWNHLVEWYGGGPEYPRKVVEVGEKKLRRVEVFPLGLYVVMADCKTGETDTEAGISRLFSSETPVAALHSLARTHFKISPNTQTRLWVCDSGGGEQAFDREKGTAETGHPSPDAGGDQCAEAAGGGRQGDNNDNANNDNSNDPSRNERDGNNGDDAASADGDGDGDAEDEAGEKTSIGDCDIEDADIMIIEIYDPKGAKKDQSPWPLERVSATHKDWKKLRVGDVLDAQDREGKWYKSEIVARNEAEKKVRVHFSAGKKSPEASSRAVSRGVVGLRNLGNTCFMNSTLQCLSNTPIFNTFFSGGRYKQDVNKVNPLGTRGKLAHAFGGLLRDMWTGTNSSVVPRDFKRAVGHFAPRFSGYQQQDSQELLAYLLDGLHEDLNRVKKKKYTNTVDAKGRPDKVVADESWQVYQLRNRSVIVDLFMGQLKSTVFPSSYAISSAQCTHPVCPNPECGNVSVTFDPFMYLSVPFPRKTTRRIIVHVVHLPPKASKSYCLTVEALGKCSILIKQISEMSGVGLEDILVGTNNNNCYYN
eukprot:jgi/Bigna1/79541/fgenesh1_pg.63_\